MKLKYIISIFCLCSVAACTESVPVPKVYTPKVYTADEIRYLVGGEFSVGVTYENNFAPYSARYSLSNTENQLVGIWEGFEGHHYGESVPCFIFYPNKFFLGLNSEKWYKVSKNVTIVFQYGIWETRNNRLYVTVYGCIERDITKGNSGGIEFKSVEPYEVELIDLAYMSDVGYMQIPFATIPLPKEYRKTAKVGGKAITEIRCYRNIWMILPIAKEVDFGLLRYIPFMAKNGVTAGRLVGDPKFAADVFSDMFEWGTPDLLFYDSYHEKNPEKYPEL
jgi:hypothetical protein